MIINNIPIRPHDRLLAQGGHYAELYNTYFRHQSADYEVGA